MADTTGYDQQERNSINRYSGSGGLPSYQSIATQQQPGYGQNSAPYQSSSYLVIRQPQSDGTAIIQTQPPDYMIPSILACLCCFWPTGICAIYYANEAKHLWRAGKYEEAKRMSNNARNMIVCSVIFGILCISVVLTILISHTSSGF